ncbi:MAG TPA: SMP-30/gluconolactonase/LRE family protein [Jatrophihabitans sp.]|nr:SMP-30/gluconolactonase/LRE family protein [Jatrophihabitans sp.]
MARLPGPPELLPQRPDAIIDLQTHEGAALVGAQWRYSDTTVDAVDFVAVGTDLAPSGPPNRTYEVHPRAEAVDFDDSSWRRLTPAETQLRLSTGRVCFNWYRITCTLPSRVGETDVAGATVVFETAIDDYAEVWVNGVLPKALGDDGGAVVAGFNAPNRVVLTTDARPGQTFTIAVFGINGPISASPENYIWMRTATLDIYRAGSLIADPVPLEVERRDARLDALLPRQAVAERVATGFEFTEGPVWRDGALLFSSPNTNCIYRWAPPGTVTVFRSKSGYTGVDVGRYHQPGSNGLTFDPDGRLVMCQHGNRRVLRVNPHGDTTVLADSFDGKRLNSPNDLVFRSDGTLYFTDPPFGLPEAFDDPKKELSFSGVFGVRGGSTFLVTDELNGPNGLAFSPDESVLYVGDWDESHKAVVRYPIAASGEVSGPGSLLVDLTDEAGDDAIDGLKVDRAGNVYICGPGGIWIVAADGSVLGRLGLPEEAHNLAWGDDGSVLYVTALTSIYRIALTTEGIRP